MLAQNRRRAGRRTLLLRLAVSHGCRGQLSHRTFVVVLVSRSRASLGVALSTCQLSLLAVALWMSVPTVGGVSKARGAEEPLGSGTMARSTVGPSQVLELLWMSVPTDVKQYDWG